MKVTSVGCSSGAEPALSLIEAPFGRPSFQPIEDPFENPSHMLKNVVSGSIFVFSCGVAT